MTHKKGETIFDLGGFQTERYPATGPREERRMLIELGDILTGRYHTRRDRRCFRRMARILRRIV